MKEKTPNELDRLYGHRFGLAAGGIILPLKRDPAIRHSEESPVGNGHTVGIAGQILENLIWAAKWWFGIDNPFRAAGLEAQGLESRWFGK